MKKLLVLPLFFISFQAFAQAYAWGPTISYQTQSGNFLKAGGYAMRISDNSFGVKIDANANMAYLRNDFRLIPEVGISLFPNADYLVAPYIEGEFTPYTITPKIGISLVHLIDFNLGYGWSIDTKKNMKPIDGFTFSIGINIPLNQLKN